MQALLTPKNLQKAAAFLWAALLVTLPVTTFRYIPGPLGRTLVKPMALYPLALLVPVLLILFWKQRRLPLPFNIRPLLAFLIFAAATSVFGLLLAPLPLRGAEFGERVVRGWLSLLVGLLFFFVAFWMNRNEKDLRFSLKWIYVGLGLTLAWSLVQAVSINTDLIPRRLINDIQLLFSDRPLLPRRVSGFAYEPAWLADQLVVFALPWLFAAPLLRSPFSRYRWLEPLLLLISLVVLLSTYSRGGLATAVICMLLVGLLTGRAALRRAWSWLSSPFTSALARSPAAVGLRLGLFAAAAFSLLAAASFLSRYEYFARVWDIESQESPLEYLVDISAGPRLAYAVAGYRTFETAPLTGVGLGASGLYLFDHYPDWSYVTPEIARQLSPDSNLIPNIKNLYVRLLAETGLPGFWFFVVFLLTYALLFRRLWRLERPFARYLATAGLFAWMALLIRNMTQDSFTFPIMWVILGQFAGLYPFDPKDNSKGLL